MSHVHAFSCICTFNLLYSFILCCWYFSDCLFLSPSLSLSLSCVCHLNANPLHPGTLFTPGRLLLLLLTPLHLTYSSVLRRLSRTSQRTFHDEAFIQNAKSFCQIFLILSYPLSSTIGIGSHCVASRLHAIQDFYSNMHEINTFVPNFFSCVRDMCIVVTLEIVFEVLHIFRVAHTDYPSCERLRIVSKDKLSSLFCETPSS